MTALSLAVLLPLIHVAGIAAVGTAFGARPRRVCVLFGPRLFHRVVAGIEFELGLFPGGFVQFGEPGSEANGLPQLHPLKRALVMLSGCLALALLGLSLGAPASSLVRGFGQAVSGPLHPRSEGARLLREAFEVLHGPWPRACGLFALKMCAFNLLPLPSLNGYAALEALLSMLTARKSPAWVQALLFVLMLLSMVGWCAALWFALHA